MDTFRHDVILQTGYTVDSYAEAMKACEEITDRLNGVRHFLIKESMDRNVDPTDPMIRDFAFMLAIMAGTKHAPDRF